jgi:hypothetical protein
MKVFTAANRFYVIFCLTACSYFSIAAIEGWPNPLPKIGFDGESFYFESNDHTYHSNSTSGRSSGGSWGGGK